MDGRDTTADRIVAANAAFRGERKLWSSLHSLALLVAVLGLASGAGRLERAAELREHLTAEGQTAALYSMTIGVIATGVAILSALFLRWRHPARKLGLRTEPSVRSLGHGSGTDVASDLHAVEGGWRYEAWNVFPAFTARWKQVAITAYLVGVLTHNTAAMMVMLVACVFIVTAHLSRAPDAIRLADLRSAHRRGTLVSVTHVRQDLAFPLAMVCTPSQWERLRATLPDGIPVEELETVDADPKSPRLPVTVHARPESTAVDRAKLKKLDDALESLKRM